MSVAAGLAPLLAARSVSRLGRIVTVLSNLGPYAAIELLLPGGSLLALLLWLYRRRQSCASAWRAAIPSRGRGSYSRPVEVTLDGGIP